MGADPKGAERTGNPYGRSVLWLGASDAPLALVTHLRSRGIGLATMAAQVAPVARLMLVEPAISPAARNANVKGRRVAVIHPDPGSADALAQALRGRGAQVVALSLNPDSLERVEALDPDAVLMEVTDFYGSCWEIVRALWQHPRLKYAPVLLATPEGVASYAQGTPDVPSLCLAVQTVSECYARVERAARDEDHFEVELSQLGPAKLLRVLTECDRGFRVSLNCAAAEFEVDVAEGIIVGAQGSAKGAANDLYLGVHALALLLIQEQGHVSARIADHPAATNVMAPLDAALDAAREAKAAAPTDAAATREVAARMSLPGASVGSIAEEPTPKRLPEKPNFAVARPAPKASSADAKSRPVEPKKAAALVQSKPALDAKPGVAPPQPAVVEPEVKASATAELVADKPTVEFEAAPDPEAPPALPNDVARAPGRPDPHLGQPKKTLLGLPPAPRSPAVLRRTTSTGRVMAVVPREDASDPVHDAAVSSAANQAAVAQVRAALKAQAQAEVAAAGEASALATQLEALAQELPTEESRITPTRMVSRPPESVTPEAQLLCTSTPPARITVPPVSHVRPLPAESPASLQVTEEHAIASNHNTLVLRVKRWHLWVAAGMILATMAALTTMVTLRAKPIAAPTSMPPGLPPPAFSASRADHPAAVVDSPREGAVPTPAATPTQGSEEPVRDEGPASNEAVEHAVEAEDTEEPEALGASVAGGLPPSRRASALVSQGHNLRKHKLLTQARARYQEALALLPGYPRALAGLVQVSIAQNKGKDAVSFAQKLVGSRPGQASYQLLLGDAYKSANMPKEAQQAWQAAVRAGSSEAKTRLTSVPAPASVKPSATPFAKQKPAAPAKPAPSPASVR